jgi:acyl-coenzyme A synthetase/AMP-(fatty) acid ligase
VLDYGDPPFARWFVGGETNLCYNAVDRHLRARADQDALVYISTETGERATYTFGELHAEVNTFAAVLRDLGVVRGDRVVIYMPMMAEAIFAMLACARLGAIHSVVFGGFAATNLATGVKDQDKGQVVFAYVVPKDGGAVETDEGRLEQTVKDVVDKRVGAIARPAAVYVVEALPKTRSGKLLRRSIQAIAEGGEPGEVPTIEDPSALDGIRSVSAAERG